MQKYDVLCIKFTWDAEKITPTQHGSKYLAMSTNGTCMLNGADIAFAIYMCTTMAAHVLPLYVAVPTHTCTGKACMLP